MRIIFYAFILLFDISLSAQDIKVFTDYKKAVKAAASEKKILLVDMYTDWCGWCKQLDKVTYKDPEVVNAISKNFIMVKLDAEAEGAGRDFAMRFGTNSYPSIYYLNNANQLIGLTGGYMAPKPYLKELDSIVALNKEGYYLSGFSSTPISMPAFYQQIFKTHETKSVFPTAATLDSFYAIEGFESERAFLLMKIAGLGKDREEQGLYHVRDLYGKFPSSDIDDILAAVLRKRLKAHALDSISPIPEIHRLIRSYGPLDPMQQESWIMNYSLDLFRTRKEWKLYALTYDLYAQSHGFGDGYATNENAWEIYENTTDTNALSMALKWMAEVILTSEEYNFHDTYAALLFANGFNAGAEKAANHAIELGIKSGADVKATKELLERIQAK